jgi:hypothetical protein
VGRGGILMRNVHIHPTEALALGEFTMVSHDFEGSTTKPMAYIDVDEKDIN